MIRTALYACLFWQAFNFTSALMAGVYVAGELGGSHHISFYGVCFFGLGNACTFPVAEALERRIGPKNVLLSGLLLFALTLLLITFSPTFPIFVILRFLSGCFSGVLFPTALYCLSLLPRKGSERQAFAFLALFVSVIPVMGACFGGWIAYDYDWRNIFGLQLPLVLLTAFFLRTLSVPALMSRSSIVPFDRIGYLLYIVSIGSLGSGLFLGQQLDWQRSPTVVGLFLTGLITSACFIFFELRHREPFFDLRLFTNPLFSLAALSVSVLFSAFFGTVIMLSLWLHLQADYTPIWIAVLLGDMFLAATILFFFLRNRMSDTPSFTPILFAVACFGISCFYSSCFNVDINFGRLVSARIFAGFGLAFFLFPLLKICLYSVPEEKKRSASLLFQSVRLFAGAAGVSIYTTMLQRRTVFYRERLGSSLTEFSDTTQQVFSSLLTYRQKGEAAKELLEKALSKQANALALADCFYCIGWIMVSLFLLLLFFLGFKALQRKRITESGVR